MKDANLGRVDSIEDAFPVTPSDTVDFDEYPRGLWVGVTGDVSLVTYRGFTRIYKNVPVGYLFQKCKRVNSTGTTASEILGLL